MKWVTLMVAVLIISLCVSAPLGLQQDTNRISTYGIIIPYVFYSGFETGDASEWISDGGGGVYGEETGGQLNIVTSPVHSGTYAAQFLVPDPVNIVNGANGQIKLFRWGGIDLTEGYYGAWYYFPIDFSVNEWINIMQWKEKASPWNHELVILAKPAGEKSQFAFFYRNSTGQGCERTAAYIPLGRWVFLEVYIKVHKTDGEVKIWVDGELCYIKSGFETEGNTPTIMLGIGNYPGEKEKKNLHFYMDDVKVSKSYIGL